MENKEFLEKFSRKIIASGDDYSTAKTYCNNIGVFMGWGKFDSISVLLCSQEIFDNYIIHLRERKLSPSYINSFIASVKRLYKIFGKKSSLKELEYHSNPLKTPNILTYEECLKMCESKIYLKHKVIINLLYYCALRRGELLRIKLIHLSGNNRLTIVDSKYGKSRTVPIPQNVVDVLNQYIMEFKPNEYLFNNDKGKDMYSAKSVENIIKNVAKLCGIEKRVYPHIMRSSCATHLLDAGASDMYVSEFLGHENLQTTKDYYCKLTIKGMQDNFIQARERMKC